MRSMRIYEKKEALTRYEAWSKSRARIQTTLLGLCLGLHQLATVDFELLRAKILFIEGTYKHSRPKFERMRDMESYDSISADAMGYCAFVAELVVP